MDITNDAMIDLIIWGYKRGFNDAKEVLNGLDPEIGLNREAMLKGMEALLNSSK